jgi:hypothetical protein
MSFVIMPVSPRMVVQVSDTRLSSLADQTSWSEELRKSLVVMGKHAHFVLGWSGFAARHQSAYGTTDWLFDQLRGMNAVELPLVEIAGNLTGAATAYFSKLRVIDKRTHFILGGWQKTSGVLTPFTCVIYNDLVFHSQTARSGKPFFEQSSVAASEFLYSIGSFVPERHQYDVTVIGDFRSKKLTMHFRGLEGMLKKQVPKEVIGATCRQIALEAAQHSKTINKNLITVEMDCAGRVFCSYHPEQGTDVMLLPPFLSVSGSATQTTLRANVVGDQITVRFHSKVEKRS